MTPFQSAQGCQKSHYFPLGPSPLFVRKVPAGGEALHREAIVKTGSVFREQGSSFICSNVTTNMERFRALHSIAQPMLGEKSIKM